MPELVPVLRREQIAASIKDLADRISDDYQRRDLILIGVLKGAFVFLADLAREISIPVRIDFLRAASYGSETTTSGRIRLLTDIEMEIAGCDVLVVEDIVDSGITLNYLIKHIRSFDPASVRVCALLDKRERRQVNLSVDYACHVIDEGFLVGYGLDYNENYRELPDIYQLLL